MRISSTSSRLLLRLVSVAGLLSAYGVDAGKETPTPTPAPSTSWPTFNGTLSPTPDPNATLAPTSRPTSTPTSAPTVTPIVISDVRMPPIGIDIFVDDEVGKTLSLEELENDLKAFMEETLETYSGIDTFDYAVLKFDFMYSSFGERRLETGLSVRIEGDAYYGGDKPTSESLATSLWTYFAVWGIEDLEEYLKSAGIPSASVATVSINDAVVKPPDAATEEDADAEETNEQPKPKTQPKPQGSAVGAWAAIAGLGAGCAIIILVLAYLVLSRRNRKSKAIPRRGPSAHGNSSRESTSAQATYGNSSRASVPVEPSPRTLDQNVGDDISVSAMSADWSIYTTEYTVASAPIPPILPPLKEYDTTRLDRILDISKKHGTSGRPSF